MIRLRRRRSKLAHQPRFQPGLEALERRDVPSAALTVFTETGPNAVITQPQSLGSVGPGQTAQVHGSIGTEGFGGADVDWFSVDVDQAEKLTLSLDGSGVVSLYDNDSAVVPLGHQLILQFTAVGPTAQSIELLPGDYEVAVSGVGNRYFSPVLAGSGTVGAEGPYVLSLAGAAPDFDPTAPEAVVRTDVPAAGYVGSPLAINVYLTKPIDLTQDYVTILDSNQNDLTPNVTQSSETNDLVLTPLSPLAAGQYQIVGYDASGNQFLAIPFTVIDTPTTDTLATAAPVGNITNTGLVQLPGVIGNDPYYSLYNSAATASNPASQVNMYSFAVSGPGEHVLTAEAFAGRIGSPLNPGLTLLRVTGSNPDGSLAWQLVAGNRSTYNTTVGSDGEEPLYSDSVLFANLTPGRYVIAVSSAGNHADPLFGTQPGVGGVFDPDQSHSGSAGQTTGSYVLNLFVQPVPATPPTVTQTSITPGAVLDGPPTQITVQFSAPMNLAALTTLSAQSNGGTISTTLLQGFPCYITDATGNRYFLGLDSYDVGTGVATFTVLEPLDDGQYFLRLSGPNGLTDLAGTPLAGNSASGDYVVPFTVTNSPARGATIALANPNDSASTPTDLGVLFPLELAAGIAVQRNFTGATPAPTDQADYYRFTLLQQTVLQLSLGGPGLTVAGRPVLLDANGNPLYPAVDPAAPSDQSVELRLQPGTYTVMVGSWSPSRAAQAVYTLYLANDGVHENPTPLTSGPAPAYRLQLDTAAQATIGSAATALPGPAPLITLPSQGTPGILLTVERGAGSALPNTDLLTGAATGLAAGPVGVLGGPSAADNTVVRLVLPGSEFPSTTAVTSEVPATRIDTTSGGPMLGPVECALRTILLYTLDWLRMPPLLTPALMNEGDTGPALVPAEPDQPVERAGDAADDAAEARDVDTAAGAVALALIGGVVLDDEEHKTYAV